MTILFAVDGANEELLQAVQILDDLAGGGRVVVRRSVTLETNDVRIGLILSQMVQGFCLRVGIEAPEMRDTVGNWSPTEPAVWDPPAAPASPVTEVRPASNGHKPESEQKKTTAKLAPRQCSVCAEEFQPFRKDQVVCFKSECRAKKSQESVAKSRLKKQGLDLGKITQDDDQLDPEGDMDKAPFGYDAFRKPSNQ